MKTRFVPDEYVFLIIGGLRITDYFDIDAFFIEHGSLGSDMQLKGNEVLRAFLRRTPFGHNEVVAVYPSLAVLAKMRQSIDKFAVVIDEDCAGKPVRRRFHADRHPVIVM